MIRFGYVYTIFKPQGWRGATHLGYPIGAQLICQGTEQRSRTRCGVVGFAWLALVLLKLLEGSKHVRSGYRLTLASVLHSSLYKLLYELLSGVHSAVKQECQEVADHQTFAKGDPQHLVFAQTKPLPDPFDVGLMPQQDGACLL